MDESPLGENNAGVGDQPPLLDVEYWPHLDLGNELFNVDWLDKMPPDSEAVRFQERSSDRGTVVGRIATTEDESAVHHMNEIHHENIEEQKNDMGVR